MFRCEFCGEVSPPKVAARRVVVETKPKSYPRRSRVFPDRRRLPNGRRNRRREKRDDPGGAGREIVREALACSSCAATYSGG